MHPLRSLVKRSFVVLLVAALVASACSDADDTTVSGDSAATSVGPDGTDGGRSTSSGPATTAPGTSTAVGDPDGTDGTETPAPYVSETYADATHWLCRPDLAANPCVEDLDLTVVAEDGRTTVETFQPVVDPGVDCFYVYPTINLGAEGNAPFDGEYSAELGVTRTQAARFSSVCDLYAPVYRQVTLSSFAAPDAAELMDLAYGDVEDAFRHFLDNDSVDRPFVLLGHSQGSGMITRLLTEMIDGDEVLRARLVSALVIGSSVSVPPGEDVGGDLTAIPACRSVTDTGCVVSYASFRDTVPPAGAAFFGRPRDGEGEALCVNPAAPGGGPAELIMITPNVDEVWAGEGPAITTPYAALPGLVTGECVTSGGFSYLQITVNADPGGPRADDIGGDLTPEWGLHAVDYNLALGDLVALVASQAAAWTPTD